jgi:hypothetical protein
LWKIKERLCSITKNAVNFLLPSEHKLIKG